MKSKKDLIAECDSQLNALYENLGKHLYENIETGLIYFEFQNDDEKLAHKAGELLDRIRAAGAEKVREPGLDKQPEPVADKLEPAVSAEKKRVRKPEPAKRGAPVAKKPEAARPADKKRPQTQKPGKAAAPIVHKSERKPEPEKKEPVVRQPEFVGPADQRGSLERYTELMIELFDIKKKLLMLKKDIEEYLSLTTIHLWDSASSGTDVAVRSLRAIEEEIISLIRNNMEAVQDLMTRKKESDKKDHKGEYSDAAVLSGEIEFFNRASADIRHTSHQVEALVKNAVTLFEEIKRIYEEGVAADMQLKRDFGLLEDSGSTVGTFNAAESAAELAADDDPVPETAPRTVVATEESSEPEDEGLLEAAARRLTQKNIVADEKLQILNTVFRSVPGRAVTFVLDLLKDIDMSIKKQIVDMLIKMDNPLLVDIYKEFLVSEDTLLRMHGIMGLKRIGSLDAKDAIISAIDDKDVNVRRLVANCLDSLATNSEMSAVMRLANDPDETVARVAIRKLGLMKSRVSFTQVLPKLDSLNEKIRKEAIDALRMMTGTDLGYNYMAPASERKRSSQSWQKLWSNNQSNPRFLEEMRAGSRSKMAIFPKKQGVVATKDSKRSKPR